MIGVLAAAADLGGERLEAGQRGDLDLQLGEGCSGRGLIEDLFFGGLDFVLRSLFEILDVVGVEHRARKRLRGDCAAALQ